MNQLIDNIHLPGILTQRAPQTQPLPWIVDSPHSGRIYPADFDYACGYDDLKKAEDNHLDHMLKGAPDYGATLLTAEFPRSYIDVNRSSGDIDPSLLDDEWPEPFLPSTRSSAGIGLIRRLIKPGLPVYDRSLSIAEVQLRLQHYYWPYHKTLDEILDKLHYYYGQAWYLDFHSMPKTSARTQDGHPVDIVIGDREGTTCNREFIREIKAFFEGLGLRVALNDPYKGVELIAKHAHPAAGIHAVQIEISKALYWDEEDDDFRSEARQLQTQLEQFFSFCRAYIQKNLVQQAAD
jgi:N-formylglutamate amidohydrolase